VAKRRGNKIFVKVKKGSGTTEEHSGTTRRKKLGRGKDKGCVWRDLFSPTECVRGGQV